MLEKSCVKLSDVRTFSVSWLQEQVMFKKQDMVEALKAVVLPELTELKAAIKDVRTEIKDVRTEIKDVRTDIKGLDQRMDGLEMRMDELKSDMRERMSSLEQGQLSLRNDIAEVRSYVWTRGLDARRANDQLLVREEDKKYGE